MTWLAERLPSSAVIQSLAIAQLWQATLVAIVVGVVAMLVARRRPHLAYLLWMLVIVKCLTPPIWASPTGAFSWLLAPVAIWPPQTAAPAAKRAAAPTAIELRADVAVEPIAPAAIQRASPAARDTAVWDAPRLLGAIWFGGSALLATAVGWQSWRYRRRLGQSAIATDGELSALAPVTAARLGLRRKIRIVVVRDALGPAALGLLRPMVVLPEVLVTASARAELEPILAHELLHHRRGDVLAGWLQLAAQVVWWFHPLVWWANRSATRQRELACDEEVVAGLGCAPSAYAQGLIGVLELRRSLRPMFVPGMRPAEISKRRIEWILSESAAFHRRTPRWCWLVMVLLAFVALPGAALEPAESQVPPAATANKSAPAKRGENPAAPRTPRQTHPITVRGRAIDEAGKPVVGATIHLLSTNGIEAELGTTRTDGDGRYLFQEIMLPLNPRSDSNPYGCFEIYGVIGGKGLAWAPMRFYEPGNPMPKIGPDGKPLIEFYVGTPPARGDKPIDVDLEFQPASSVKGRLVDESGAPVADASVSWGHCSRLLRPKSGDKTGRGFDFVGTAFWAVRQLPDELRAARSDKDGHFELGGLSDGLVLGITVEHPRYGNYYYRVATDDDAAVPDPDMNWKLLSRRIDGTLRRSRTVRLAVSYADSRRPAAQLSIYAGTGVQPLVADSGKTNADGAVEFKLPPGEYQFNIDPPDQDPRLPYVRTIRPIVVEKLTDEEQTRTTAPSAQHETAMLALGCVIECEVVDADSQHGIAGIVIDEERTDQLKQLNWGMRPYRKPTDDQGKMRAVVLPGKRRYFVSKDLTPPGYTVVEQPNEPLTLEAGKVVPVKFVLRKESAKVERRTKPIGIGASSDAKPNGTVVDATPETDRLLADDDKLFTDAALQGSPKHNRAVIAIRESGGEVEGKLLPGGQIEAAVTIAAGWKAGPDGLKHLVQFDRLKRLKINDILAVVVDKRNDVYRYRTQYTADLRVTDDWLAPLAALKGLNSLEIHNNCHATDAGLAHLAGLVELETLAIGGQGITDVGMAHLAPLTKLRQLYLHNVKISDAGLTALAGAKNLELLNISSDQLRGEGFKALSDHERLNDLGLQYCPIDDQGLEAISRLKPKRLLLGKHQVTDAGLAHLKNQDALEMLVLEGPQSAEFTGAGLANLAGLKSLRDLRYGTKNLKTDDLAALAGLEQLTFLMLEAPVTDEGLAHLSKLSGLTNLYLLGATITDAGTRHLYGLKRLKNLALPSQHLSEAAIEELRKALPGAEIQFIPAQTVNKTPPHK